MKKNSFNYSNSLYEKEKGRRVKRRLFFKP